MKREESSKDFEIYEEIRNRLLKDTVIKMKEALLKEKGYIHQEMTLVFHQ